MLMIGGGGILGSLESRQCRQRRQKTHAAHAVSPRDHWCWTRTKNPGTHREDLLDRDDMTKHINDPIIQNT